MKLFHSKKAAAEDIMFSHLLQLVFVFTILILLLGYVARVHSADTFYTAYLSRDLGLLVDTVTLGQGYTEFFYNRNTSDYTISFLPDQVQVYDATTNNEPPMSERGIFYLMKEPYIKLESAKFSPVKKTTDKGVEFIARRFKVCKTNKLKVMLHNETCDLAKAVALPDVKEIIIKGEGELSTIPLNIIPLIRVDDALVKEAGLGTVDDMVITLALDDKDDNKVTVYIPPKSLASRQLAEAVLSGESIAKAFKISIVESQDDRIKGYKVAMYVVAGKNAVNQVAMAIAEEVTKAYE